MNDGLRRLLTQGMIPALLLAPACTGQDVLRVPADAPWSVRIGESFLLRHPGAVTYDSVSPSTKWNYEQGLMLTALLRLSDHTGDERYREFVRRNLDLYVRDDGSIDTYRLTDYNLDNIAPGRAVLEVYAFAPAAKYRAAADTLRRQLREQPRTKEGGFWHKKIYPWQMWLDGLYMAQPFLTRYALLTGDTAAFDDIAAQFIRIERHTRDSATGLLYHAWDESRLQRWADPATGRSPHFWGRAMGWYAMALVDVLEVFPAGHPDRDALAAILQRLAGALTPYQDPATGLWYQVVDQGTREGNYLETSVSAMLAYAFARGVHLGLLDASRKSVAERAFRGVLEHRVTVDAATGLVDLHGTCRSAGLGGTPYRDGSFAYYISEPTRINDMKGLGPLLLAAVELEQHRPR